jgi:hypothetical protein
MKTLLHVRNLIIYGCAAAAFALNIHAAEPPREHLSLDANWKFHLGNDWPGIPVRNAGSLNGKKRTLSGSFYDIYIFSP